MNNAALRAESRKRYPKWSRAQRARWVWARLVADRVGPKWASMVPMTEADAHRVAP